MIPASNGLVPIFAFIPLRQRWDKHSELPGKAQQVEGKLKETKGKAKDAVD